MALHGLNNMKRTQRLNPQQGFTLIELMLTITVMTIVLFIGSSLTSAWVDQSQVNNATSSIQNAISQAKALALRNTNNTPLTDAAASACLESDATKNILKVVRGACTPSTTAVQVMPISNRITIKEDPNSPQQITCISFNSIGVVVPVTGCLASSNPTLTIGKNNESATIVIR